MKPHARTGDARRVRSGNTELAARIDAAITSQSHPWQFDAAMDPARRITLLTGRGATKTTTMMLRGLRVLARVRSGRVVYCASSRPMAEELMWAPLKDTCERLGLETGRDVLFHETKMRLTFLSTGATLRLVGVDDKKEVDKLRGQPFDEVDLDEASIYPPELLDNLVFRVVGPRLGDRLGVLLLGGTPGHIMRGLFYDATRPGATDSDGHPIHRAYADRERPEYEGWIGWSSHAWSLDDVVARPDAADKYPALVNLHNDHLEEKARNKWGDDHPIWMREYRGLWSADNTEMVFRFRPSANEWDPLAGQSGGTLLALKKAIAALPSDFKDWRYIVSCDMGSKDPFACNVFAFAPSDPERRIWHVFGFEQVDMYAQPIATLLLGEKLDADKPDGVFGLVGWPDACVMDADQSTIDELGKVYGVQFAKVERKRDYKFGAIELVNGDLVEGRLKILRGSPLYTQLQELQWQEDQYGNLQENKGQANHSTDCLVGARVAIAALFASGTVEEAKPTRRLDPGVTLSDDPSIAREPKGEYDSIVGDGDFDGMFGDDSGNYF